MSSANCLASSSALACSNAASFAARTYRVVELKSCSLSGKPGCVVQHSSSTLPCAVLHSPAGPARRLVVLARQRSVTKDHDKKVTLTRVSWRLPSLYRLLQNCSTLGLCPRTARKRLPDVCLSACSHFGSSLRSMNGDFSHAVSASLSHTKVTVQGTKSIWTSDRGQAEAETAEGDWESVHLDHLV